MRKLHTKRIISFILLVGMTINIISFNLFNTSTVRAANAQIPSNEYFKSTLTNQNQIDYYEFLAQSPENWFDGSGADLVYTINYGNLGIADSVSDDDMHVAIFGSNDWFSKVIYAVMSDHPEIFWVDWTVLSVGYQRDTQNKTVTYSLSAFGQNNFYHKSYSSLPNAQSVIENDYAQLMAKAQKIVEPTKTMTSSYDKLLYLNTWIVSNNKYASDTAIGTLDNRRTAYSSIMSNNDPTTGPVCVGYSYGYQLLCNLAGLNSVIVSGKIYNTKTDPIGTQHAWNRVMGDDGNWYDIDTTWNDVNDLELFRKGYFMVGYNTDTINPSVNKIYKDNHKADSRPYPPLSNERYIVPNSDKEAFINNTAYTTVEEAFQNATPGDTITLNSGFNGNIQIENTIIIDKNITLDLNGKTLMTPTTSNVTVFTINSGATLIISDTTAKPTTNVSEIKGMIQAKGTAVIENNGNCVINSGKLYRSSGGIGTTVVSNNAYTIGNNSMQIPNTAATLLAVVPVIINDITVTQQPAKTSYTYGEYFDPQGLVINVNYSNSTTKQISYDNNSTGFSFTPSLTEKIDVSTQNITVTYTDGNSISNVQIPITVNKAIPSITTNPTASAINKGESLANSTLKGGNANVDGVFSWKNPNDIPQSSGDYTVVFTPNDQLNYESVEIQVNVQVIEHAVVVTPPTAVNGLIYNSNAQNLIIQGNTNRGEMQYSLSQTQGYSTQIPKGTNAGTYTVWYKVVDNTTSTDITQPASIDVEIAKAIPNIITNPTASAINKGESLANSTLAGGIANVNGAFSWKNPNDIPQSSGDYTVVFTPNDQLNYESVEIQVNVQVIEQAVVVTPPTAVNGLIYNSNEQALITKGSANRGQMQYSLSQTQGYSTDIPKATNAGVYTVWYKVVDSNSGVDLTQPANIDVEIAKATPTVNVTGTILPNDTDPNNVTLIKVSSVDGEVSLDDLQTQLSYGTNTLSWTFVPNDRNNYNEVTGTVTVVVTDTILPTITGVENNTTYTTTQKVTVDDANLSTVTLNGVVVGNEFTLQGNVDEIYTIAVTDKAGNQTVYIVYMKPIETVIEQVKDITQDNVTLNDKQKLENAVKDLNNLFNNENLTQSEKTVIEENLNKVNSVLNVIKRVETIQSDITSLPDTVLPDDTTNEALIDKVKADYDNLSDYEKTLLPQEYVDKLNSLLNDLVNYQVIVNESILKAQSGNEIIIKLNGAASKFVSLEINGKVVDPINYTIKSGSTIITLNGDFTRTLQIGKSTFTANYTDGKVSGEIEVLQSLVQSNPTTNENNQTTEQTNTQENKPNLPIANTSDNQNAIPYVVAMMLSSIAVIAFRKKLNKT